MFLSGLKTGPCCPNKHASIDRPNNHVDCLAYRVPINRARNEVACRILGDILSHVLPSHLKRALNDLRSAEHWYGLQCEVPALFDVKVRCCRQAFSYNVPRPKGRTTIPKPAPCRAHLISSDRCHTQHRLGKQVGEPRIEHATKLRC